VPLMMPDALICLRAALAEIDQPSNGESAKTASANGTRNAGATLRWHDD